MTLFTAQVRDVSTCGSAGCGGGGWEPLCKHMRGSAGCGGGVRNDYISTRLGAQVVEGGWEPLSTCVGAQVVEGDRKSVV
jgi:hypothetical protein